MTNKPDFSKMFNFAELEDLTDEAELDETVNFNEEDIKANLPTLPSTKLADLVVANRYLGIYHELSILAMEELAKRRTNGDEFAFEQYIDENFNSLPKLTMNASTITNLFDSLKTFRK